MWYPLLLSSALLALTRGEACVPGPADVMFILSSNHSLTEEEFNQKIAMIEDYVKAAGANIGPDGIRIGVIAEYQYSDLEFDMAHHNTKDDLLKRLPWIWFGHEGARQGVGFEEINVDGMDGLGGRPGVPDVVIYLTTSNPKNSTFAHLESLKLQATGATVIGLGIGEFSKFDLLPVASGCHYIDQIDTFAGEKHLVESALNLTCDAVNQVPCCDCCELPSCCPKDLDVMFLLDGSSGQTMAEFHKQQEWAQHIVQTLNVQENGTRVGGVVYADHTHPQFYLGSYPAKSDVLQALEYLPQQYGGRQVQESLEWLSVNGFTSSHGSRQNIPKVLVVTSVGPQGSPSLVPAQVSALKAMGVEIVSVGVTPADPGEVAALASDPSKVIMYPDFDTMMHDNITGPLLICGDGVQPVATPAPATNAPTTDAPETAAPTTADPSIADPTTAAPETVAPTTAAPTTVASTTATPTTAAPTTAAPTTAASTTAAPTTAVPTTAAPTTAAPTTAASTTAAPTTAVPTTAAPTTAAPTTASPTTAAPTTATSTTAAPTTAAPTTAAPTTAAPTTAASTTAASTTAAPTTAAPTTAAPTTAATTQKTGRCDPNPCLNGGDCVETEHHSATCLCLPGYNGAVCETKCDVIPTDVIFVLDASRSEGIDNFNKQVKFVFDAVTSLDIGPNAVQVGMMSFSSVNHLNFHLNRFQSAPPLLNRINSTRYQAGLTMTADALKYVREEMLSVTHGGRPGAQSVVVVLTDGVSTHHDETLTQAAQLRATGAIVLALGLGNKISDVELTAIASEPKYKFVLANFNLLTTIQQQIVETTLACSNTSSQTTSPPTSASSAPPATSSAPSPSPTPYSGPGTGPAGTGLCKESNPCMNNGTCYPDGANDFICECLPGFAGTFCFPEQPACPQDFKEISGSCYRLINSRKTFNRANQTCNNLGAHLAEPRDHIQNEIIKGFMVNNSIDDIWLGSTLIDGNWKWLTDGHMVTWNDYAEMVSMDPCMEFWNLGGYGGWADKSCDTKLKFICQADINGNDGNDETAVVPVSTIATTLKQTTHSSTTQAPTTQAPTTQAPTTQAPTTKAPTRAPTTLLESLGVEGCKEVDIAFLVEHGPRENMYDVDHQADMIRNLVTGWDVGHDQVRVAVNIYNDVVDEYIEFDSYMGDKQGLTDELEFTMNSLGNRGRQNNVNYALDFTRTNTFQHARPNKVCVAMVHEMSATARQRFAQAARAMKNEGITLYVLGVDVSGTDRQILHKDADYYFEYSDWSALEAAVPNRVFKPNCPVISQ